MKIASVMVGLGFVLLAIAHYMGLFVAPNEASMGETGRILYVHVPTAWVGMVAFCVAFICAVGGLWTGRLGFDATLEASVEVGVVFASLLLVQGSIWARPTWGVYWTWDPRLTTSAVMLVLFGVVLLLRRVIEVPERRMTLSAIATVVAFADVPVVYFSVKWWRTLHQPFSNRGTVSDTMLTPFLLALFAMSLVGVGLIIIRTLTIRAQLATEADAPELPDLPAPLHVTGQADEESS